MQTYRKVALILCATGTALLTQAGSAAAAPAVVPNGSTVLYSTSTPGQGYISTIDVKSQGIGNNDCHNFGTRDQAMRSAANQANVYFYVFSGSGCSGSYPPTVWAPGQARALSFPVTPMSYFYTCCPPG